MIELPVPTAEEQAFSQRVLAYIQQQIDSANGLITFSDYMQSALYAPGLGYYVNDKFKLGRRGDFITAPEISPAFSMCMAKQIQQVLRTISTPIVLEFGAGSGIMAADILTYLLQHQSLPEEYWIMEPSPALQALQQKTLAERHPEFMSQIKWLTALPKEKFSGVIVANEVLDAMSVERFSYVEKQFQQVAVNRQLHDELIIPTDLRFQAAVDLLPRENFCEGYTSEINLWLSPWVASVSELLQQGLILLVDYGYSRQEYYHPQRAKGTLMCYYHHRGHENPFFYPGLQDITAHVDFTAVAEAADRANLTVSGFVHQAAFLLSCDIENMPGVTSSEIKQLLLPSAMGEVFKVMALTRNFSESLLGFALLDQRGRL